MVEGTFANVVPLNHGVVPFAQTILVPWVPGKPRASMTAPAAG
jgi:hypothetical protein